MWSVQSYLEPVMEAEQEVVGEVQHYFSKVRQRPEGFMAANPNQPRIERIDFAGGNWQRNVTPVIGQGNGGVTGSAARTGLVVIGDAIFVTECDLSTNPTGLIGTAVANLDGESFELLSASVLPALDGVAWARLNLFHVPGTYRDVIGLAEGMFEGDWQVFLVTAPSPDGPYTVQNGEAPMTTLRPAGMAGYGSGSLTRDADGVYWTHYHAGPAGGATEIYRSSNADILGTPMAWSDPELIVALADVPLYQDKATRQLADACYCPDTGLLSMTQVNQDFKSRAVFMVQN